MYIQIGGCGNVRDPNGIQGMLCIPFVKALSHSFLFLGLNKKYAARSEYDKAITETENAFGKILESSKTLLHVLRRESQTLKTKVTE